MYGFLFTASIKDLLDSSIEEESDIMDTLNDMYSEGDILFGKVDGEDQEEEYYCYAAVEITNDIYKDAEDNFFSMDLDQIKAFDKDLYKFIDGHEELSEVAYCDSPRIFFVK
jgi:hypothetical protein